MDGDLPEECDFLVVGGGATGMAFCDSLLGASPDERVVLLDPHAAPGGQWHDSYGFVRLHQPSAMYGVEGSPLEPNGDPQHLATRVEILDYYQKVADRLAEDHEFRFVGNAMLDLNQHDNLDPDSSNEHPKNYTFLRRDSNGDEQSKTSIRVTKRLVDARFLQPDLPVSVPPKFSFDATKIRCVPINELATAGDRTTDQNYVVVGAGKTGMDGVYHLLNVRGVDPSNILWVIPHDPWITARENTGNCIEFLRDAVVEHGGDPRATFRAWEQAGKIYRLFDDEHSEPTKFMDATLSRDELDLLRRIPASHRIRGKGRLASINDDGSLLLQDPGRPDTEVVVPLPFGDAEPSKTLYLHCSAGAFNYSRQIGKEARPVFEPGRVTLQDVYGTPGFCFVGSLLGRLAGTTGITDASRNALLRTPAPSRAPSSPLGAAAGMVPDRFSPDHGYIQRLRNLKGWLGVPELRGWLVGHRLFHMGHYGSASEIETLVDETLAALEKEGLLLEPAVGAS